MTICIIRVYIIYSITSSLFSEESQIDKNLTKPMLFINNGFARIFRAEEIMHTDPQPPDPQKFSKKVHWPPNPWKIYNFLLGVIVIFQLKLKSKNANIANNFAISLYSFRMIFLHIMSCDCSMIAQWTKSAQNFMKFLEKVIKFLNFT